MLHWASEVSAAPEMESCTVSGTQSRLGPQHILPAAKDTRTMLDSGSTLGQVSAVGQVCSYNPATPEHVYTTSRAGQRR